MIILFADNCVGEFAQLLRRIGAGRDDDEHRLAGARLRLVDGAYVGGRWRYVLEIEYLAGELFHGDLETIGPQRLEHHQLLEESEASIGGKRSLAVVRLHPAAPRGLVVQAGFLEQVGQVVLEHDIVAHAVANDPLGRAALLLTAAATGAA